MNEHIFRLNDIRGDAKKDLTPEVVYDIARAFGTFVNGKIVVGIDCRKSSLILKETVVKGLLTTGCKVVDIGMVTSPQAYFAAKKMLCDGCFMITGSHCPTNMNGFKLSYKNKPLTGGKLQELKQNIIAGKFNSAQGLFEDYDSNKDYLLYFLNKFNHQKKLKIVIDCGNATAGLMAPKILRELGHEIVHLYCNIDPSFPNHHPDPSVQKNLSDLRKKVLEEEAHLGIAFDGDGDRVGFVDDTGKIVSADRIMAIIVRMLEPKSKVVFDVKCSKILNDELLRLKHVPIMSPTGNAIIRKKALKEKACFAGELSGHFFWEDNNYFDDGLFMVCKLLNLLCNLDLRNLSVISLELPEIFATPEIRVSFPDEKKFELIQKLKYEFLDQRIIDIDGVRVEFHDGWGLARASQTEPALTFRFESFSEDRLKEIQRMFDEKVSKLAKEI